MKKLLLWCALAFGAAYAAATIVQLKDNQSSGPSTVTNFGSGETWSDPDNVEDGSDSGAAASVTMDNTETKRLKATRFNDIDLPTGSTVDEITVRYVGWDTCTIQNPAYVSYWASLLRGGNEVGSVRPGLTRYMFGCSGAANDLKEVTLFSTTGDHAWDVSTAWTVSQINADGFGVSLWAKYNSPATDVLNIDYVEITVDYTVDGKRESQTSRGKVEEVAYSR